MRLRADLPRVITEIESTLDSGCGVAFFPEGTFRAEPGLRRFHQGAFVAAKRGNLDVVPIVISGSP